MGHYVCVTKKRITQNFSESNQFEIFKNNAFDCASIEDKSLFY